MRSSSLSPAHQDLPSSPEPTETETTLPAPPSLAPPVESTSKKPRSKHHSPTPPPQPPPPPLQTIRLDITLGGPADYEVDIAAMALCAGQRVETPVPENKADTSESEPEPEPEGELTSLFKRKKRKSYAQEYYDTNDPFIDDSELAIDERKFFAQTKQRGFYVSSGQVALLKDTPKEKPPMKPRSKLVPNRETKSEEGTRDSPIALYSDSESAAQDPSQTAQTGQKRKRYISVVENGKKRKVVDVTSFDPKLQEAIDELKAAIAAEDWTNKGKFPPNIKPILAKVALKAVELNEYDDHFFNLMPTLFPYNKFTMTKLIKRTIFADHTAMLAKRQEDLLEELAKQAKAGFAKAEEDWQHAVVVWDRRQEKQRLEASSETPGTRPPTEERDREGSPHPPGEGGTTESTKEPQPPHKKYRMTESMKNIVWELVLLSNECCRLENEKNQLEGSIIQVSEQGLRKVLYQKIVAAYPEGWMSSGQISRDVSAMKKRLEREAMETGD
ncbi:uncharacterized protein BT62DRAFT_895628 [Guyanagaster necrorhizus]|uniref:Ubinuclein middle domain-containing protein n=1 Tax=Guyanagaster necrorhizus TaxID=856835 RepID=A0A9P8ATN6_9AGAR|nr:uncharacterized protein BT62DRAFT_895628 [Guyanagaster necrorhizus MCA 3950]KAG7446077.1 hypothetical protein BT62DRAFT_895628 [Guyanagaster necrorhizus MCA 3950]